MTEACNQAKQAVSTAVSGSRWLQSLNLGVSKWLSDGYVLTTTGEVKLLPVHQTFAGPLAIGDNELITVIIGECSSGGCIGGVRHTWFP